MPIGFRYHFEEIGPLPLSGYDPDNVAWFPSAINDEGTVVGGAYLDAAQASNLHAFSFTTRRRVVFLSVGLPPGPASNATGINAAGQIGYWIDQSGGEGGYAPGIFTDHHPGGPHVTPLPLVPGYTNFPPPVNPYPTTYFTFGINGRGQVVGYAATLNPGGSWNAGGYSQVPFLSDNRAAISLGSLGDISAGQIGIAYAINDRAEVVGSSQTGADLGPSPPAGPGHAFLYRAATGIQDLNNLTNSPAWLLQQARDINALGEIVGYGTLNPSTVQRAFHYEHGIVRDLGTFWNGGASQANGISNRGEIVGYATLSSGSQVACIFFERFGPVDLNHYIDPALGWHLTDAVAVNNVGQIVGYCVRKHDAGLPQRGFLLTPATHF
ncbi:MAG: hypothetical protein ABSH50_09355 [Bryobacteraceae bacterium]|jgi:probable HAF family extracellular repeat protein